MSSGAPHAWWEGHYHWSACLLLYSYLAALIIQIRLHGQFLNDINSWITYAETQQRVWIKDFFFWSFSIWEQGQNCDSDGVCQPGGSVWLHLWQEEHLWTRGQALLQANSFRCALLPSGKAVVVISTFFFFYSCLAEWECSLSKVCLSCRILP